MLAGKAFCLTSLWHIDFLFVSKDFITMEQTQKRMWTKLHVVSLGVFNHYPGSIYLFEVNNRNTRKRCEICSDYKNTRTTSKCTSCARAVFTLYIAFPSTGVPEKHVLPFSDHVSDEPSLKEMYDVIIVNQMTPKLPARYESDEVSKDITGC